MSHELSPYQIAGAEFLMKRRFAYLADEMGLGKTAQAIIAADSVGAQKILIICPAVARINWKREFEMWSVYDQEFSICEKLSDSPTERIIVSYEYATMNVAELIKDWDLIIVDEAHFIKEPGAIRTKAILGKNGLVRSTKRMWMLSGTPAPNHAGELWPMLHTFGAYPLSFETFLKTFCNVRMVNYGTGLKPKIAGTKTESIPHLKTILNRVLLRRRKTDVLKELPPISYYDLVVEETPIDFDLCPSFFEWVFPEDRREELYAKLKDQENTILTLLGSEAKYHGKGQGLTANGMTMLEGVAKSVSTLRRWNGLKKMPAYAKMVAQELEDGAYEKIVIFAIHRDVIENIRLALSKFGAVTLYGGTPPAQRQKNIDKFQNNPKIRVFIGNIKAAGTAITLTRAHNIDLLEQEWVPGDNAQAIMRVHRRGQEMPVTVRVISLADSIDQPIAQAVKRKTRELTAIFDSSEEIIHPDHKGETNDSDN